MSEVTYSAFGVEWTFSVHRASGMDEPASVEMTEARWCPKSWYEYLDELEGGAPWPDDPRTHGLPDEVRNWLYETHGDKLEEAAWEER